MSLTYLFVSAAILKVPSAPGTTGGASIVTVRQAMPKSAVGVTTLPAGVRMVVPAQPGQTVNRTLFLMSFHLTSHPPQYRCHTSLCTVSCHPCKRG